MIRMSETESEECYGQRKTGGSKCEVVCEFFVSSLGRVVGTEAGEMREKGGGSIVFINSNTAYRAISDRVSYSASKSGALGMMRAMALDLGKYNIRVNAVLPGMIKTDRWENNYNDCRSALSNYTPLGDIADFEDIANAAWYFGSDMSKNTTGAELVVDGGNMIQLYPIVPEGDK